MRAKKRCPKRIEAETGQRHNTDPTPLPHGSWNDDARGQSSGTRGRAAKSWMPNSTVFHTHEEREEVAPAHEGGTATLKQKKGENIGMVSDQKGR